MNFWENWGLHEFREKQELGSEVRDWLSGSQREGHW